MRKFSAGVFYLACRVVLLLLCYSSCDGTDLSTTPNVIRRFEDLAERTIFENHKPVFPNCLQYNPTVKEEQPGGTFVVQVVAKDIDPVDQGGNITYKFVSGPGERRRFNIEETTGVITTEHVFDRDEPSREKETYVTVQATDNGVPPLADVCTIKVVIEDINDNPPVFDRVSYTEYMSQDLEVSSEVMRISATDIDDGNNSVVTYKLDSVDATYFEIETSTGVIKLKAPVDKPPQYVFRMKATATDHGDSPQSSDIDISVTVLESNKKAPSFTDLPPELISFKENFSKFGEPLATLRAASNMENKSEVLFELVTGRTDQTNKQNTFILESLGDTAYIKLGKQLDYEAVTEYILTVRVQNNDALAAETNIRINVLDVNDNIPVFTELIAGSVPENEPVGTPVMQVRAYDADGTSANNIVSYQLADPSDPFAIDSQTGNITTLEKFDREERSVYYVKVLAIDNSPSALLNKGEPNKGQQTFRIEISDKNDNKPRFTRAVYVAEAIPEDANIHTVVTEVTALDNDTASPVIYSIISGNIGDAFKIENTTGKIRVNEPLDYETITNYTLTVRAYDGVWGDECRVEIQIANVNDNPPELEHFVNNTRIREEEIVPGCVAKFEAYDPDIKNRSAPQRIEFFISEESQKEYVTIDKTGCLQVIKPLDRDPPFTPERQLIIGLADDDAGPTALKISKVFTLYLEDINDNAPVLDIKHPVVWYENQPPGMITNLTAKDIDSEENGAPFTFRIDENADDEIKRKFAIKGDELHALVEFDREEKKFYLVPIAITDSGSPPMTGVSILEVIIGDRNDHPMKNGTSEIFVYNYKGETGNVAIGRVYVDDPDDWDLADKSFRWAYSKHPLFDLDVRTGMIKMLQGANNDYYILEFEVFEESINISRHQVNALVNVTVKEIPEEAVDKSGSIRFVGLSAENFVEIPAGIGRRSRKQVLQEELANIFNTSVENVDVFTVLHSSVSNNESLLDVRFSAHGSPYYSPEKLNTVAARHQEKLERDLDARILMINIDECLVEKQHCESSCANYLNKSNIPYSVYTNRTSFVGVRAEVAAKCECLLVPKPFCHNNGTLLPNNTCKCQTGFTGPRCEVLSIAFYGDGWAMYPPFPSCSQLNISFDIKAQRGFGLVLYLGPLEYNPLLPISDFMALELQNGYPVLIVDYGTGAVEVRHKRIQLTDGKMHNIEINLSPTNIEMFVDNCRTSACFSSATPIGKNSFLNVNAPLQLGGSIVPSFSELASNLNWTKTPTNLSFSGCLNNLTVNDVTTYNLGEPSYAVNAQPNCNEAMEAASVHFGIDSNFLVAILVCIAVLLILLLAVVVHRRRQDPYNEKDMDDIRENIINYEDEGGGEVDTDYDLNVFPKLDTLPPTNKQQLLDKAPPMDEEPDIPGFLAVRKNTCDKDPDTNPFDDVRHYAYEGDGNTSGSLSSLASCTDEGDLKFSYLSNFGPRFRKLADMYGATSDDDSQEGGEESWC